MNFESKFRHFLISVKTLFFTCMDLAAKYKELIRYGVFGVLTTAVDFGVYTLLAKLLSVDDTFSNAVGWFAAVVFAFITNKLFVFNSKTKKLSSLIYEFGTFIAARAVTGIVYIGGYALLTDTVKMNGFLAKAILSVFNIVVNYIFSKLVTFKKKTETEPEKASEKISAASPKVKNGAVLIGKTVDTGVTAEDKPEDSEENRNEA